MPYHVYIGLEGGYMPDSIYPNYNTLEDAKECIRDEISLDYSTKWIPIVGLTQLRARDIKRAGVYGVAVGYLRNPYQTRESLMTYISVQHTYEQLEEVE